LKARVIVGEESTRKRSEKPPEYGKPRVGDARIRRLRRRKASREKKNDETSCVRRFHKDSFSGVLRSYVSRKRPRIVDARLSFLLRILTTTRVFP